MFRNYCLLVFGKDLDIIVDISSFVHGEPNILTAGGMLIATFISNLSPSEITTYMKDKKRNFFIFDLDQTNSGFNILDKKFNNGLFGFLEESTSEFLAELNKSFKKIVDDNKELNPDNISRLSSKEKNNLINKLIDKGIENLSIEDRRILKLLSE